MKKLHSAILVVSLATLAAAQTAPKPTTTKPSTTAKPSSSAAAKPATAPAAKQPIQALIQTTAGDFNCTLFPDKAPITVDNFVGLATGTKDWKNPVNGATMHNKPFYDGTVFHRVIPNFMIQGGDPLGNGSGGPGYSFRDEQSDLTFDQPGRLAMANSGPNTNGSQFFITEVPTPHLDGHYNIFGQCDNNALVKQIARAATDPRNDRPFSPVKITHIKITNPNKPAAATKPATTGTKTGASTTKKTTAPTTKPQ
jgi:cyclophilin family peptidyl-prolyl cis-trans isomerase